MAQGQRRDWLAKRRRAMGYSQESLAYEIGADPSTVRRWEQGRRNISARWRQPLAEALKLTLHDLDVLIAANDETVLAYRTAAPVMVTSEPDEREDDVQRRQFMTAAVALAVGIPSSLQSLLSPSTEMTPSVEDIRELQTTVAKLAERDSAFGGGALCDVAITFYDSTERWLRQPVDRDVAVTLQELHRDLGVWIGWLAYDACRPAQARRYLHDAIAHARVASDPVHEVQAMAHLSLLLAENGQADEAIQCAQLAQRISSGWPAPRTGGLLHLRLARAHAYLGESEDVHRELAAAEDYLNESPGDQDPLWIRQNVTPSELPASAGTSYVAMDEAKQAVTTLQQAVESPCPGQGYTVSRTVSLADAILQTGDASEASRIALQMTPKLGTVQSERTGKKLRRFRRDIGAYAATTPKAGEFVEAYDGVSAA